MERNGRLQGGGGRVMTAKYCQKMFKRRRGICVSESFVFFSSQLPTPQLSDARGFQERESNNILTHFEYSRKLSNPKSDFGNWILFYVVNRWMKQKTKGNPMNRRKEHAVVVGMICIIRVLNVRAWIQMIPMNATSVFAFGRRESTRVKTHYM